MVLVQLEVEFRRLWRRLAQQNLRSRFRVPTIRTHVQGPVIWSRKVGQAVQEERGKVCRLDYQTSRGMDQLSLTSSLWVDLLQRCSYRFYSLFVYNLFYFFTVRFSRILFLSISELLLRFPPNFAEISQGTGTVSTSVLTKISPVF